MKKNVQGLIEHLSATIIHSILTELSPFISEQTQKEAQDKEWLECSSKELLQAQLVSILTTPEKLAKIYAKLSTAELVVLKYFIFQVSADLLTYRHIAQGVAGIKPIRFRLGLTGLRRKGLVYTVRRQWGEVAYLLPSDLGELLYQLYVKVENKGEVEPCFELVTKVKEEFPPVYIDLFLLLNEFRAEKGSCLPLTKKGSIHKRYVRAWQDKLPEREPQLDSLLIMFEHRDTYNQHSAILLDFLTREKLISWFEEKVELNERVSSEWMKLSRAEMRRRFCNYWLLYFTPSSAWLNRYQKDMLSLGEREWIYLLSPVERWEEEYSLPTVSELKSLIVAEIIQPLQGLGFIEVGVTEGGEEVWRWKVELEEEGQIWVQPTLEVYASSFLPFSILWELTKMLQIEQWENMLILHLSKPKVLLALERGESVQEWVSWLETSLGIELPFDFKEQLNLWQRSQEQVLFSPRIVIEIGDEQLAQVWLKWPELEGLDVRQVSPRMFLVAVEKEAELMRVFAKRGFPVKKKIEAVEDGLAASENRDSLLSFSYHDQGSFKVESVFPKVTEAIPAWQTLPDIWKKQFGAYHEQTKRKIVEQAIEHELRLKVEMNSGDIVDIFPKDMQVEAGRWVCYEGQGAKLALRDINKLQILFPV